MIYSVNNATISTFTSHDMFRPQSAIIRCLNYAKSVMYMPRSRIDKYSRSGIYQMKCMDCPLKYIRQTGRTFNTRYREHIHDIRSNNSNSGYSKPHIEYGTITDTMEIITTGRKEKYLNTMERYHIYKISTKIYTRMTHILKHTTLYLKHCMKFTQNRSTPPLPTSPSPLPHYIINMGVSTLHIHNVHTQRDNIIRRGNERHGGRNKMSIKGNNIT